MGEYNDTSDEKLETNDVASSNEQSNDNLATYFDHRYRSQCC